jgi:drug/metabolite transporter (DMT)-like permease
VRGRLGIVDAMLATTVLLWSLSVIASRYAISHGFAPIAFSAVRQVGAATVLGAICIRREGGLLVAKPAVALVLGATALGFLNQIFFVYAVRLTTASTVGMLLGTVPILTALIAAPLGLGRLSRALGVAAAVSFAGVALVTLGAGQVDVSAAGVSLAFLTAASWAGYSVTVAQLTATSSSPLRISALVMLAFTPLLLAAAGPQLAALDYGRLGWGPWACVTGVAAGTVASTIMWFTGLERVGASHAALFANLQPFFVVVFGVLLLSERLSAWTLAGGAGIAAGLVLAWRARPVAVVVAAGPETTAGGQPWS